MPSLAIIDCFRTVGFAEERSVRIGRRSFRSQISRMRFGYGGTCK